MFFLKTLLLCVFIFCAVRPQTAQAKEKKSFYSKAAGYFKERKRPLRHFLSFSAGAHPLKSVYPLKTSKYPLFLYLSYRKERWGSWKQAILFSLQYEHSFYYEEGLPHRFSPSIGFRWPTSHDLKTFYVDVTAGTSFLANDSLNLKLLPFNMHLLFNHITSPKHKRGRFYIGWGVKMRMDQKIHFAPVVLAGLDYHL